ncbi:MAG TPA: M12 family metallo-peptidase [Thermoanaerobaculia bacterium]|nr:M12 family metallo-peptidase [Thermoanaerobaculia bacterium]
MPPRRPRLGTGRRRAWTLLWVVLAALSPALAGAQTAQMRLSFTLPKETLAARARQVPVDGGLRVAGVPLAERQVALTLERFELFTPDAVVVVHENGSKVTTHAVPNRTFFRGGVEGDPSSTAFLSVGEAGDVRGLVIADGATYVLGAADAALAGEPLIAKAAADAAPDARGFECDADALPVPATALDELGAGAEAAPFEPAAPGDKAAALYSITVAIETDVELFNRFGSVDTMAAYIGDLMGAMSAIYYRDVNTTLRVNLVSAWTGATTSDPWTATSPSTALCELGTWWHTNRPTFPRGTVHFLSGKSTTAGIAWIGVLCSADFSAGGTCAAGQWGGGYGVTMGISGTFNPANPNAVNWDLLGATHEIGHNFNSPHTHCYNVLFGAGQEVDRCSSGEQMSVNGTLQACYSGATCVPSLGTANCGVQGQGNGTIMSYCHNIAPSFMSNTSLTFGATAAGVPHPYGNQPNRVSARMNAFVAGLSTTCHRRRNAPAGDFNGDGRAEVWVYRGAGAWIEFPLWPGD